MAATATETRATAKLLRVGDWIEWKDGPVEIIEEPGRDYYRPFVGDIHARQARTYEGVVLEVQLRPDVEIPTVAEPS